MLGSRPVMFTEKVPIVPAATALPLRSVTGVPPRVTVYVPLSSADQEPPGGVIW